MKKNSVSFLNANIYDTSTTFLDAILHLFNIFDTLQTHYMNSKQCLLDSSKISTNLKHTCTIVCTTQGSLRYDLPSLLLLSLCLSSLLSISNLLIQLILLIVPFLLTIKSDPLLHPCQAIY